MKLGILCGGRSGEHEVSLQSALGIHRAVERERFEPVLVAIDKAGAWRVGEPEALIRDRDDPARIRLAPDAPRVVPVADGGACRLVTREGLREVTRIDVFFPIVHGTDGEDGALQGMLRMMDVPFVGADVLGSAIGMDKDVMKRLLAQAGLPLAPWVTLTAADAPEGRFDELSRTLGTPLFVKPATLGSSVGVGRAADAASFAEAVRQALRYDDKVLVEQAVTGREIECSVLGNRSDGPPQTSRPGEIVPRHEFYSYAAKYLDDAGAELKVPAELAAETEQRVREVAAQVFTVLECDGLARVDSFVRPDGSVVVNEINTLPGFTPISMYPKLWEVSGLPYPKLLTRLVELGLARHARRQALSRSFEGGS